jgi:hypothetical protein
MSKLVTFLFLIIILTSCKEEEQTPEQQTIYTQVYNIGDVLYLKPDSLKAVVQDFDKSVGTYQMFWREGEDYPHVWVSDSMIYGTVSTTESITQE